MTNPDDNRSTAEKIAGNVTLLALSRLSMMAIVPLFMAAVVIAGAYFNGIVSTQERATNVVSVRVDSLSRNIDDMAAASSAVATRVSVIEANNARGRQDRMDFQEQITSDIRDMRQAIVALSNNVAALTATVQGLKERQAFNGSPSSR